MEALSGLVKVTLPNYLSNLPIPNSFTGWFKLGSKYKFSLFFSLLLVVCGADRKKKIEPQLLYVTSQCEEITVTLTKFYVFGYWQKWWR